MKKLKAKLSKRIRKVRRPRHTFEPLNAGGQSASSVSTIVLAPSESQSFLPPEFFGPVYGAQKRESYERHAPQVDAMWVKEARVIGATNFILSKGKALHPSLFRPERDCSPLELWGQGVVDREHRSIRVPLGIPKSKVPRAVNLCDQTSGNYAHWLTETLPKLVLLDELEEHRHLPLLVDGWIHPNHLESIQILNRHKRRLIPLDMFQYINVDEVLAVAPTAYCPHEYRDYYKAMREGFNFYFSGTALNLLRSRLRTAYAKYVRTAPRKIYIQRNLQAVHNGRHVTNIDDLEDIIFDLGIETINVTGLTFAQQAKLFINAEFIVAPTGAALANMIFAKPGCKIIVMAAAYEDGNYDYFAEMAQLLGHELSFVVGRKRPAIPS